MVRDDVGACIYCYDRFCARGDAELVYCYCYLLDIFTYLHILKGFALRMLPEEGFSDYWAIATFCLLSHFNSVP